MTTRRYVRVAVMAFALAVWAFAPAASLAQTGKAKADAPAAPKIYLFKAEKKLKTAAGESLTLLVADAFTGRAETLHVANADPESKEYNPAPEIRELVEGGLDVNTPLEITTEKVKGKLTATSVKKAETKPGEELPNGFVFVETREDDKTKAVNVKLSKFGREVVVGVPMVKDDDIRDAEWEPDPKIDYVVRRLQSGDVVEVVTKKQSNRVMISEIYQYRKPERGKFIGFKEVEFDGAPAAGFEIAAEDGTTITFTINGMATSRNGQKMFSPNPQQLSAVKRIKKDTDVEVRYTLDGRTWMMLDIRPLSAADKSANKSSPAASKGKKAGADKEDMQKKDAKDDEMKPDEAKEDKPAEDKPAAEKD